MDRLLIQHLNETTKLEHSSFEVLRANILKARNSLEKSLPNFYDQPNSALREELDAILTSSILEGKLIPIQEYYEVGLDQGYEITAKKAGVPRVSSYFAFTPRLNTRALAFIESEYTNIIKGLSDSLKNDILRTIQAEIAQGSGIHQISEAVLGTGLAAEKGRGGNFKRATHRAATIARTVTNDILNRAAIDTYEQLNQQFPELKLKKEWVTTSDSRTSTRCNSLSGQIKPLDKPFESGDGWRGHNAPAHPNCRSRIVSVVPDSIPELEKPTKKPGKKPAETKRKTPPKRTPAGQVKPTETRKATVKAAQQASTPRKVDLAKDPGKQALQWHLAEHQNLKNRIQVLEETNVELQVARRALKELDEDVGASEYIKGLKRKVHKDKIAEIMLNDEEFSKNFAPFIKHLNGKSPNLSKSKAHRAQASPIMLERHNYTGKQFARELEPIFTLVQGRLNITKLKFDYVDHRGYTNATGLVNVGGVADKEAMTRVLYHEIGHHLEFDNRGMKEASQAFIKRKATGPTEKLSKLTGNTNYGDQEIAYPDHFIHPYAGKIYANGLTEITSMGLENFSSKDKVVNFYLDHEDHFWHTVGILEL